MTALVIVASIAGGLFGYALVLGAMFSWLRRRVWTEDSDDHAINCAVTAAIWPLTCPVALGLAVTIGRIRPRTKLPEVPAAKVVKQ